MTKTIVYARNARSNSCLKVSQRNPKVHKKKKKKEEEKYPEYLSSYGKMNLTLLTCTGLLIEGSLCKNVHEAGRSPF